MTDNEILQYCTPIRPITDRPQSVSNIVWAVPGQTRPLTEIYTEINTRALAWARPQRPA